MATEQLEVERKFDVDATFDVPDLTGLGGPRPSRDRSSTGSRPSTSTPPISG